MAFLMKSPSYTPDNPAKSVKQLYSWAYQLNEYLKYMFSNLDAESFSGDFLASVASGSGEKLENLEKRLNSMEKTVGETPEWKNLDVYNSTVFSNEFKPGVIRIGNIVHVSGAISLKSNLASGAGVFVCTLPEEYRPGTRKAFLVPHSSGAVRMDVHADGTLKVMNNTTSSLAAKNFVSITVTFVI